MNVLDAVSTAFTSTLDSRAHRDGELITLPISLSNGNLVQIYVEQMSDDLWFVSDDGVTAQELAMAGVNLASQKPAIASWAELIRSLPLDPPVLRDDVNEYELAGLAPAGRLGTAMLALAEGVIRGEGLRALAPSFRARRFRDVIVKAATTHDLPVLVDAPMPTKHGGHRKVSVKVIGRRETYMQAVSARGAVIDGFDKAQAVFSSAEVPPESLVAVMSDGVRLDAWQWETLRDLGTPVLEAELDRYMSTLAPVA